MCLYILCLGDKAQYEQLRPSACSLGAAFQKINFLRDLKTDYEGMQRVYFPNCDFSNFSIKDKAAIEQDIQKDFDHAHAGIIKLPIESRFGVYVAYKYYLSLLNTIKKIPPSDLLQRRVRISNFKKTVILSKAYLQHKLNIL